MLHFYKFSANVEGPVPARDVYVKRGPGKGWPEECPPMRAASAFGWDVLASFDMTFLKQKDGSWRVEPDVEVESDWVYEPEDGGGRPEAHDAHGHSHGHGPQPGAGGAGPGSDDEPEQGTPLVQRAAWFWDKDQALPHVISAEVYPRIRSQVKVSTFLFLHTDPNELLLITDIPNLTRPFRVFTALVDTDWYPASYAWHCVLELNEREERIVIAKGTPLCRLLTVRRDHYFAREMAPAEFERFFQRGQEWLLRHGKGGPSEMMDITGAYVRQQQRSKFTVIL